MTALQSLSELARSLFSFWALALCLTGVFGALLAATQKRFSYALFCLPSFLCSYLLWQVLFDLYLQGEEAVPLSLTLGGLPWGQWTLGLAVLTLASLYLLIGVIRYGRRRVTPSAVKHCLDRMPCGVCCWQEEGRVLFSNLCMNRLCLALTGGPLLNGDQFRRAVGEEIRTLNDRVWRFSCRELQIQGERLWEMIASDVTDEYAQTLALERDKAELSRIKGELEEYTLSIDDTVRRQEILQAKVHIHDEMNRLMLSTVAAQSGGGEELDRILSLWEQNALLLCLEAEERTDADEAAGIEKLARALKIRLIRRGELPAALSKEQRSLFYSAAREAAANAAKHAAASVLEISFEETDSHILCRFVNDGAVHEGEVRFTGGLLNLSLLAAAQGAQLSARGGDGFTLLLCFPKNQPNG